MDQEGGRLIAPSHGVCASVQTSLDDWLGRGLFADADYAGFGESLKSTSGAHLHIQESLYT